MADNINQYQGTQGHEREVIKVEGLKASLQKMKDDLIGIPNQSEAVKYTQAEADAYNALLTGALDSTTPLTAEQAAAYNTAIAGATKKAGDTLSENEANLYNATLDGAVTTDDVKTPAVPTKVKDYVDVKADKVTGGTANNFVSLDSNGNIKDSGKKASDFVSLLDTHNKNLVFASPSGAAGLPSFRALVASDIPDLSGTYLTSHQSIKSLTLQGDGTTVSTFTANSAALTFNFKAGSNISLTRGTNEITIANTYSYSHPTGGANTTIAAANGKVLSAITVNNLGHVTSVSSKTLVAADIPDLSATYLTSHQSIYALKIQGDGTDVTTYTPNSATKTFNLKGGSNISLTRGTNEITIANTYSYSHPTGGANTTISAANGKVLSAITVNNLGHVTSVSSKTLSTSDIPDLSASYISTSGGGITSGGNTPLSLTSTTNYCKIYFVNSAHSRTIGISSSGRFFVSNIDGQSNEYQIWHAGNDGAGSGLDADLLDGQEGSYYAAASSLSSYLPLGGGTMTGDLTFKTGTDDTPDMVWLYASGREKARIWFPDTPTSAQAPNYRIYKDDTARTCLYNGTLATSGQLNSYLPLSAGSTKALTGDLYAEGNIYITKCGTNQDLTFGFKKTTNNTNMDIGWDWDTGAGAGAFFRNKNNSSHGGSFGLYARNSTSVEYKLLGTVDDAALTWNGTKFNVVRTNNSNSQVLVQNSNGGVQLYASTNRGVYDPNKGNWLLGTNGTVSYLMQGNVGIGTTSPSYKLHVNGSVGATAFTNTSDIRNKDFVSDLTMDIEQIANAPSFKFRWKTGNDKSIKAGSSAQYWNMVLPEVVTAADDEQHTLSMQYDVIALLSSIAIAKEVVNDKERIKQLEQRVSQLEAQLAN